uniref:EF-hand domain-containing protein n=1 Tax=Hemiselmis tepida TaxID=464990 RepID=A0A7S0Z072_9CRYP|mmetsp:Transcript_3492/g.8994  ORF Transcript_3492/g.8994 Transcript_3492/m.8994 type:complete len:196 (+) Transcript_3492:41-628(+)
MGATSSVQLSDRHVEEIMANTDFDRKQVQRLWKRFNLLDAQGKGYISKSDFDFLPELANNPMADRILQCLRDANDDEGEAAAKEDKGRKPKPDEVDFATFVRALDCFSPSAPPKRKLDLMYRLYDFDGDGLISRQDLTIAMDRVIGLGATKERIEAVVDQVFAAVDEDQSGTLDFEEFCSFVDAEDLSSRMTVPI